MNLVELLFEDIEDHLRSRGVDPEKTKVIMDKEAGIATFLLYNLSGQLVGYQRYNPKGVKNHTKDIETEKYYTYVTKESPKVAKLAVWGLETIYEDTKYFFVVEGIFDCVKLHNAGYPAIAVLANNPQPLKGWFKMLNKVAIAIMDNDEDQAGNKLRNIADYAINTPEGYKDLGDMTQEAVNDFIKGVVNTLPKKNHSPETVVNPETDNKILVKTALSYPAEHPAHKEAERLLNRDSK